MKTDFHDTLPCQKCRCWRQNTGERGMQEAGALMPQKYCVETCVCSNRNPTRRHDAGMIGDMGSLQRHCVQGLEAWEESWARAYE